jgi:uncharacterized membrane protein YvbJ
MAYCTRCGKKTQKGDVFCRKCGARLEEEKPLAEDGLKETVSNLEGLVDEAAQGIKRELLAQISKIEEEIKNGKLTVDEFHAEANEIRQRLLKFIQK